MLNSNSSGVQPRYTPVSTPGVTWYSQRLYNVYNGKEYEVQIITGQLSSSNAYDSPLFYSDDDIEKQYYGQEVGLVNLFKVVASDVIVSGGSNIPVVGDFIGAGATLYDLLSAYLEGVNPTSEYNNTTCSYTLAMTGTMRFTFVKYSGNPDDGYQILGCVANSIYCACDVSFPLIRDDLSVTIVSHEYEDSITSYGFDIYQARAIASENFWNYKLGYTDLDQYHLISRVPFTLMNSVVWKDVPYAHP